jgi:RNA polymerase-binding protein DksA
MTTNRTLTKAAGARRAGVNLDALGETLRARLETLRRRVAVISSDLRGVHAADSGEQAVERENEPVLEQLDAATRSEVEAIRRALERIERGGYGVCEACGRRIGVARLRALPTAATCVRCQEAANVAARH